MIIEVDHTTGSDTTNVSRDVAEELERQEESNSMALPENWDPSRVQAFYNEDGADPDAPRITTRFSPPTPEPEFLSEGLLATLTSGGGTGPAIATTHESVSQSIPVTTSPVVTALATSVSTTPPPATVQAHRTASGTTTKVC